MPLAKWPLAQVETLRALAEAGKTSGQIAAIMGITRNAVIGAMHRRRIPLEKLPRISKRQRRPKPAKSLPAKIPPGLPPPLPRSPPLQGRMGAGPAILALEAMHCQWPIGDPTRDDFHFCAEPRDPDNPPPYCPRHTKASRRA